MAAKKGLQVFVTRLHWTISKEALSTYFQRFGTVRGAQVMFDMKTGFSRGFGYVNMSTPEEVESIISTSRHHINGLEVVVYQNRKKLGSPGQARPVPTGRAHTDPIPSSQIAE